MNIFVNNGSSYIQFKTFRMEEAHKQFIFENYYGAIAEYTKIIESQPANSDAFIFRGIAYIETGQYNLAIVDLENSDKVQPNNFQTLLQWGIALFYEGKFEDASTKFKSAEGLAKEDSEKKEVSEWIERSSRK